MLPFLEFGAGKESRTLDLNLGKVALYQLSYSRIYRSLTFYNVCCDGMNCSAFFEVFEKTSVLQRIVTDCRRSFVCRHCSNCSLLV